MLTNKRCRVWNGLQAFGRDGLAGNLTEPVGPLLDAFERPLDLRQLLPIPRIFVELCLPLTEEVSLILEIADPLLVPNGLLDTSFIGGDPRFNLSAFSLEALLESTDVLRAQHAHHVNSLERLKASANSPVKGLARPTQNPHGSGRGRSTRRHGRDSSGSRSACSP